MMRSPQAEDAAASTAAAYRSCCGRGRADFIYKLGTRSKKSMSPHSVWLEILRKRNLFSELDYCAVREADELTRILVSSRQTPARSEIAQCGAKAVADQKATCHRRMSGVTNRGGSPRRQLGSGAIRDSAIVIAPVTSARPSQNRKSRNAQLKSRSRIPPVTNQSQSKEITPITDHDLKSKIVNSGSVADVGTSPEVRRLNPR